jgi:hypothetical protein
MVEEIERIAGILHTPNLEQDTLKLLNETLREMISEYRKQMKEPKTPEQLMTPDMFREWLHGQEGG